MRHIGTSLVLTLAILMSAACSDNDPNVPDEEDAMVAPDSGVPDAIADDGAVVGDDGGLPDASPPRDLGPPIPVPGEVLFVTQSTVGTFDFSSVNRDGSAPAAVALPPQNMTIFSMLQRRFVTPLDGPFTRIHGFFGAVDLPGGRVVFATRDAPSEAEIWLVLYDGTNLQRVAVGPYRLNMGADIAVSPDSSVVFWSNDENLHAVRVDGSTWANGSTDKILPLGNLDFSLTLLHQDAAFVYVEREDLSGAVLVQRASVDGMSTDTIALPSGVQPSGVWRSSANGAVTAFVGIDGAGAADVYVIDGAAAQNVSGKSAAAISSLWISPDGSRVAYTTDGLDAYVVGADGTGEVSVRGVGRFDAAVDFDDLAMADADTLYLSAGSGSSSRDVYSVNVSSLEVVNLTATGATMPPYDGGDFEVHERFLAGGRAHYVLQDSSALCDNCYYLASVAPSALTYVIEDGDGYPRDFTQVSPDEIVFISGEDNVVFDINDLYSFDPTAPAAARQISDIGGLQNRTLYRYEISPDGSRIAFITNPLQNDNDELWVVATSGGTAERVGADQVFQGLRWMRDNAGFVHIGAPDGQVPSLYYTSVTTPSIISAAPADMYVVGTR